MKLDGKKSVLQNFPEPLLARVDTWAERNHLSRTDAVNQLCVRALDQEVIEKLKEEIATLRTKVVALGMDQVRGGKNQK
jgi:hypothetical protein